jgi:superfamily II DNA or RNA helicase
MFISDKIYLEFDLIQSCLSDLCNLFTYKNPDYYTKKRMGYSVKKIAPTIYNYKYDTIDGKKYLVVPRGGLKKVKEVLSNNGIVVRLMDKRTVSDKLIDVTLTPNIIMSDNQKRMIEVLHKNDGGLIEMGCGGGKTKGSLGFISSLKKQTLIIVHTSILQKQWLQEIETSCIGDFSLGRLDGKHKVDGDVVVAIIDSLVVKCKVDTEEPDYSYLDKFECVILDESQTCPATTFKKIMDNTKCKYRIGVTGTPTRKDGMHFLLFDTIGQIILKIEDNELKDRIESFEYEFKYSPEKFIIPGRRYFKKKAKSINLDYNEAVDFLVTSENRNNLIIENVIKDIENGYVVMVLTYRTEHAYLLFEALKQKHYGHLIIGDTSSKIDFESLRKDMDLQFIVANRAIASEGMDIPHLSCLHATLPTTNMQKLKQQLGRIRRVFAGKKFPKIVDYVDSNVMCKAYDEEGAEKLLPIMIMSAKKRETFYKKLRKEYSR